MPSFDFDIENAAYPSGGASCFSTQRQAAVLRPYTVSTGKYDPVGTMNTSGVVIVTPSFTLANLQSLFSFEVSTSFPTDSDDVALGTILYRLSLNGGTAYYYWNGSAWTAATTSSHFCTLAQMQAHIATFPLPTTGTAAPRLSFKITPDSTGKFTPALFSATLCAEVRVRPFEDAVASVITHIMNNLTVPLVMSRFLQATASTITLGGWTRFTILSVTHVYDLTADPGRRANLYQSFNSTTGVVTLTGSVATPHEVEVQYTGRCPVTPLADDVLTTAVIPNVGVMPLRCIRNDAFNNWREIITNKEANKSRSRLPPEIFDQRFRLYCVAARNEEALQLSNAATQTVEGLSIPYLPTGEQMTLVSLDHMNNLDFEPRGLYSKQVEFTVQFRRYSEGYTEVGLVQRINTTLTDAESTVSFDQDTVS